MPPPSVTRAVRTPVPKDQSQPIPRDHRLTGYLVVAVCNFDDIPVGLFSDQRTALRYAKRVRPPKNNPLQSWDITGFIGVKVLFFKNGRPRKLVFHQERPPWQRTAERS